MQLCFSATQHRNAIVNYVTNQGKRIKKKRISKSSSEYGKKKKTGNPNLTYYRNFCPKSLSCCCEL
jgi:ferritin